MKITLVLHKYSLPLGDPCCYPMGYMYVSSILKAQGHDVKILNYNLYYYDLKEEIKGQDLVCFTGFEEFKQSIIRDAKICRDMEIATSLGGALATFCTKEMSQYVDLICSGEFGGDIPIDSIPYPDYNGFGVTEYHKRNGFKHIGVLASRGCPFRCSFCIQTCAYRERSIESVNAEIDHYKAKYSIDRVVFNDNTLNVRKSRFLEICDMMKDKSLSWSAAIRADIFDDEMAIAAKNSNCGGFVIGIESFKQDKLDKMNKHLKVNDIYRTLDILHKHDLYYHGNLLVGFEGESYTDIAEEVLMIPQGSNIFPCLVQPFIGTQNGRNRAISEDQTIFLNKLFKDYVCQQGMYQYPDLPKGN